MTDKSVSNLPADAQAAAISRAPGEAPAQAGTGDRKARRNAIILAMAQALYGLHVSVVMIVGSIIGNVLADDKSLATLPITAFVIGTATITAPASLLMRHIGRRLGFIIGAGAGVLGAFLAIWAIREMNFALFCISCWLGGAYQAFAQYYRFAAADTASPAFAPKAISWVMLGGMISAYLGPQLMVATKDWFAPITYAGSFAAIIFAGAAAIVVVSFVDIPLPRHEPEATGPARALTEILSQKRLLVAIGCGMIAFAGMSLIMTATPLAMIACNHTDADAAFTIQWHALAMYGPSFVTGRLIVRFGVERIVLIGLSFIAGCALVALSGVSVERFVIALVFLGVGWNFAFVGATAMVTECYRPAERAKVQAFNDFVVFSVVALASLSSGKLLYAFGWSAVNLALLPFVAIAFLLMLALIGESRRRRSMLG